MSGGRSSRRTPKPRTAWAGAQAQQGMRSRRDCPANGLATDGEPRTCKREHGERSAASPRSPQAQGCAWGEPSEPTDERGDPGFWGAGHSCASLGNRSRRCPTSCVHAVVHSRHRCLPARKSGVPFLSVPCFGHAKIRRPSYGGGCAGNRQASSERSPRRTGLPRRASPGLASESTGSEAPQAR